MRPRLLVVDDSALLRELLYVALRDRYEVTALADAERLDEALDWYEPDVVLLDARLSGKDGLRLRSIRRRAIPVVLMTAANHARRLGRRIEEDADGFLTKPFTAGELLATLDQTLHASFGGSS